jgi:hypothetical protein
MARLLNQGVLPAGYYAVPNLDLEGPIEIDVAALRDRDPAIESSSANGFALWTPPQPAVTVSLDFPPIEYVEVQVLYDEDAPQLTAAVELVSPSNKDRPAERRAFAIKCVSYLQQGSALLLVDTVTNRRANFHAEIVRLLELAQDTAWQSSSGLYAAAYHMRDQDENRQLEVWPEALALGQPLPRLPLWLGVDICVPLDLEASYLATCADLRIRLAG